MTAAPKYYDCMPMEIWQECWKFKAYQESKNVRLETQRKLILYHKEAIQERKAEELRVKPEDRTFYDRQGLAELKHVELYQKKSVEEFKIKNMYSYQDKLHHSWKEWLFYQTPIHFPKKKIRLK